jgi:hypothetical protein
LPAFLFCLLVCCAPVRALEYQRNAQLGEDLRSLATGRETFVRVRSLVTTAETNDLWLVELGGGSDKDRSQRPAMLVVAGIEGNDLAGTVSAVAWIEHLARARATNEAIQKLLDTTTVYVLPRVNPDAAARFFARPRMESTVNNRPGDEDHDGLLDEDGPDDLDADGLIAWMRVKDPNGEFILDPAEPRLLLKADRAKGEVGAWRLLSEGRDNDHDDAWNEDGVGGVNFNRNFPCNYRFFAPGSGQHQVSEPETRALADFVIGRPNIGIVFTFGAADNLVQTPKGEAPKRPPTALHEEDVPFYRELGRLWRDTLGLKKELAGSSEPGTFSDWLYFHRGRLSLAARAWNRAIQLELAKPEKKDEEAKPKDKAPPESPKPDEPREGVKDGKPQPSQDKPSADTRHEEERAFLKWIDGNAPELFVPWKPVTHPDFPGQTVELGGFAPFAKSNPPEKLLGDLARKHAKFLTELAGKLPRVHIRKSEAKPLGNGVFEVKLEIENTGYLPTALAQGELSREVYPSRVVLSVDEKRILAGTKRTMLGPIPGSGGMKEVRWVIQGRGLAKLEVEVVSMLGGTVQTSLELKEGN